jgi:hypothetical protein
MIHVLPIDGGKIERYDHVDISPLCDFGCSRMAAIARSENL